MRGGRAAGPVPFVAIVQGLHGADSESLAVVEYLADHVAGEPLMLVVKLRVDEAGRTAELARALAGGCAPGAGPAQEPAAEASIAATISAWSASSSAVGSSSWVRCRRQ